MRKHISWTRLPFGDGRWLIFSPRSSRTYLLAPAIVENAALPALLGLKTTTFRSRLDDPAQRVERVDGTESRVAVGRLLCLLYIFFHRHRKIASMSRAICLTYWLARMWHNRKPWEPIDVGRKMMAVEQSVGISDCYPRALLTAYLCMKAGLSCNVTVGILAPSSKMHAWCSTGGVIPYEPHPQHWYYSPLVVFDISQ